MHICPKCGASMKFVHQYGGGYWTCRTCWYIPEITYSNRTYEEKRKIWCIIVKHLLYFV